MTQVDLADTPGLTPVHMNRVLTVESGPFLDTRRCVVTLGDAEKLLAMRDFSDPYLQQGSAL